MNLESVKPIRRGDNHLFLEIISKYYMKMFIILYLKVLQ